MADETPNIPAPEVPPPDGTPSERPAVVIEKPADTPAEISASEAARILRSMRKPKEQTAPETKPITWTAGEAPSEINKAGRAMMAAEAAEESTAPAEDAAPPVEEPGASGETEEAKPELPAIEPPKSWTADAKERWRLLPRETQEYLAERESERDRGVERRLQEAAEARKTIEAERTKVEQARQQYEAAPPQLLLTLQQQQAGEFNDVKTIEDVERLAREDWPRYLQWDLAQKKIAAVQQEAQAAQQRQQQELHTKFSEFAKAEDRLLRERVPDMADAKKAGELQEAALATLKSVGFDQDELGASWNGQRGLSLRDHRVQLLILDATKWRDAQEKAKQVKAKPVPPVQRPGVSQGKSAALEAHAQSAIKQLKEAKSLPDQLRASVQLLRARRAGAR